MDLERAVVHRSVVAVGMGAGPGKEAEASSVVGVVTVGARLVAADLGSNHLLVEAHIRSAVAA